VTHLRRTRFGVPLLLFLTLALVGGAGGALAAGAGSPGNPGSSSPVPEEPVDGGPAGTAEPRTGDGALRVRPEPGIVNPIPHAFDHITISGDGRLVTVYYWGGVEECYGLASVDVVRDRGGALVVTVMEGARAEAADRACIDIALLKSVAVTLDTPAATAGGSAE
jgi:hypothetical protein